MGQRNPASLHHQKDVFFNPTKTMGSLLVGGFNQPLWKICVRQLGWWNSMNSQYMFQTFPNHQPVNNIDQFDCFKRCSFDFYGMFHGFYWSVFTESNAGDLDCWSAGHSSESFFFMATPKTCQMLFQPRENLTTIVFPKTCFSRASDQWSCNLNLSCNLKLIKGPLRHHVKTKWYHGIVLHEPYFPETI